MSVEQVYEAYNQLKEADGSGNGADEAYKSLLAATKGDIKAKELVAPMIPQFISRHAALAGDALNALMDLVEDEDATVRQKAIQALAAMCKTEAQHAPQVANVLAQLLAMGEDEAERAVVDKALRELFSIDGAAAFEAGLAVLKELTEEGARKRLLTYLERRFGSVRRSALSDSEDKQIATYDAAKAVLEQEGDGAASDRDVSALFRVLLQLPIVSKEPHRVQELAAFVSARGGLGDAFEAGNEEQFERWQTGVRQLQRLYRFKADVSPVVSYVLEHVVPSYDAVPATHRLGFARALVAAARYVPAAEIRRHFANLHTLFISHLPTEEKRKEEDGAAGAAAAAAPAEEVPSTDFGVVECLLAVLHVWGAESRRALKQEFGLFVPSGQPSDFASDVIERKEDTLTRLAAFRKAAAQYSRSAHKQVAAVKRQLDALQAAIKATEAAVKAGMPAEAMDSDGSMRKDLAARRRTIEVNAAAASSALQLAKPLSNSKELSLTNYKGIHMSYQSARTNPAQKRSNGNNNAKQPAAKKAKSGKQQPQQQQQKQQKQKQQKRRRK